MNKPNPFLYVFNRIKLIFVWVALFIVGWMLLPLVWSKVPKLNVVEIVFVASTLTFSLLALIIKAMIDYDKFYGNKKE